MAGKKKIVAIQQPEHLPWIGFFNKMVRCDQYVYLDNVQFKKRYFENRNRIRSKDSSRWVTVPVLTKERFNQKINEVLIDDSKDWRRKYLGTIKQEYAGAEYFDYYYAGLEGAVNPSYERLLDLNLRLIDWLRLKFRIGTPTVLASEMGSYEEKGSDLILAICRDSGATTYISGPAGRDYLDIARFSRFGIKVIYDEYNHPFYRQLHTGFISHMSVIDVLFCEGSNRIRKLIG